MRKLVLFIFAVLLFLSGCNDKNKAPRTEEFFSKNIALAKELNKECLKNGISKNDFERSECINASNAVMKNIKKPNRNDNNYKMGF